MKAMFFRRRRPKSATFEDRLEAVRASGFELERLPDGRLRVARDGCGAIVSGPAGVEQAGWIVGGGIAALVDGGFQKFWQTGARLEPALASQLQTLHAFEEDLRQALGLTSFYNTSLGTTNDRHSYDRLAGRQV